jgi:putative membrane protein
MFQRVLAATAVTAICFSGAAVAADKLTKDEQTFLRCAAVANLKEIEMSKAAQDRAQDSQVKQFAQQMVQDHQQATDQLKQLAKQKDVNLPNDLPKDDQEEVDALRSLQGKDFDMAYVSAMKAEHLKDVSKFSDKAATAKDPEVRAFAAQLTPQLQTHTQHVMGLAQAQGLPTISGSGTAQPAGARIEIQSTPSGTSGATDAAGTPGTDARGSRSSGSSTGDNQGAGVGAGATGVGASGNAQQTTGAQGGAPDTAGGAGQGQSR